jgi:hypothetical protein
MTGTKQLAAISQIQVTVLMYEQYLQLTAIAQKSILKVNHPKDSIKSLHFKDQKKDIPNWVP